MILQCQRNLRIILVLLVGFGMAAIDIWDFKIYLNKTVR
jgi:hypothetical protein